MRMTRLMLRTQKQVAAEAELPSHQLTLRAGLARRIASGIYSLTPLAYRVIWRIEAIVREEMERIGGQEILLPVTQPAELWQESGRYAAIDASMARFQDRGGHPMVLAMTHEEAVTDLARSVIDSYRQLPLMVFQVQTKFRDEPRPRAGLIRLREFLMKDAYSFHASQEDLDAFYDQVVEAYEAVFRRAGIPVLVVQSDTGMMGGRTAHEFMLLADGGEDTLIVCPGCGYAANQEIAVAGKWIGRLGIAAQTGQLDIPKSPRQGGMAAEAAENEAKASSPSVSRPPNEPLHELYTPGATSISDLGSVLGCTPAQTLKSLFYTTGQELVLALIRGDLEVSEVKLRNLLGHEVRPLSVSEAEEHGLTVGYAGPVGLRTAGQIRLVADDSVLVTANLVAGANRVDYHLGGVNYGRDFIAERVGDIAVALPGHACERCGAPLEARRGIEVGNTFKLGTKYSTAMGATFTDEAGVSRPMIMGCYGIGITRLLASVIEHNHDADGIIWPAGVAPYSYHLLVASKDPAAVAVAEEIFAALGADQVLFDDRDLSPGVKFKDADLLGMPIRITVSPRSLAAGGVEVRVRRTGETRVVQPAKVREAATELLGAASGSLPVR